MDTRRWPVIFQPSGRRGEVREGQTILEASWELGAELESVCGEKRTCGKCRVRIEEGFFERYGVHSSSVHLSPFVPEEKKHIIEDERQRGYRLGCVARILGPVVVFIPEESRVGKQVVRKALTGKTTAVRPAVTLHYVELPMPTLEDPTADLDRLRAALFREHGLPSLGIDYQLLRSLPSALRRGGWRVTAAVWMEKEVIAVLPGRVEDGYGLAVDVGTTTVAGYLCSLRSGELVATDSFMNPQVRFGEDVMSRITYAMTHPGDGLRQMGQALLEGLNEMVRSITGEAGLRPEDILEVTLVGNTAMHHILLGIDPEPLGVAPFTPATYSSLDIKARELGLRVHPSANVHLLPIEAGFVGADNVGVLIATEPYLQDEVALIIDIGTNGELVLGNRHRLLCTSCATGPALEGAHIRFGMRAAPGAIERVRIDPETREVSYRVIASGFRASAAGAVPPKGICGSGIIDAVAELFRAGIIDRSGRFRRAIPSPRARYGGAMPEFVIAWKEETSIGKDITISQEDVRNVQLAKAALYAGAKLMMGRLGVAKVDRVVLAGAFGSYIDPQEAMVMGLFPDCDLAQVYAVGNAAGEGARLALVNRDKRREAERIARQVEYLELTVEPEFQRHFVEAMHLPHMKDPFPHLQGLIPEERRDG